MADLFGFRENNKRILLNKPVPERVVDESDRIIQRGADPLRLRFAPVSDSE